MALTLPMRRGLEAVKTKKFPAMEKEIVKAAGYKVPVEVDWDALAEHIGEKGDFEDKLTHYLAHNFVELLVKVLPEIAADDMGKEALKAGVKKISIGYAPYSTIGPSCVKLEAGVLSITVSYSNMENFPERFASFKKIIEKNL